MKHTCLYCKTEFEAPRKDKHYCDASCRQQAYMLRRGTMLVESGLAAPASIKTVVASPESPPIFEEAEETIPSEIRALPAINEKPAIIKEKEYKPTNGKFIAKLVELLERRNYEEILKTCVKQYPDQAEALSWINIRLRCLVETLLNVSERSSILLSDLIEITNAFTLILISSHYILLPESYPYLTKIKELRDKLKSVCQYAAEEELQLKFNHHLKLELLAMRCELRTIVPRKPFSQLQFKEQPNQKPCKTNHHHEVKPQLKLWQIKYQEEKKKE